MQRVSTSRGSGGSLLTLRRDEEAAGLRFEGGGPAGGKNLPWRPTVSDSQRIGAAQNTGTQQSLPAVGFDRAPNVDGTLYESNEPSLVSFDYDDKLAERVFDKLRQEENQCKLLLENSVRHLLGT